MGDEVKNALASLQGLVDHLQHDGPVTAIEAGITQFVERLNVLAGAAETAGWYIVSDFLK